MTLSSETPSGNIIVILNNGRDAFKKCDYETALKHFSLVLELDPHNQIAYYFTKKIRFKQERGQTSNT